MKPESQKEKRRSPAHRDHDRPPPRTHEERDRRVFVHFEELDHHGTRRIAPNERDDD